MKQENKGFAWRRRTPATWRPAKRACSGMVLRLWCVMGPPQRVLDQEDFRSTDAIFQFKLYHMCRYVGLRGSFRGRSRSNGFWETGQLILSMPKWRKVLTLSQKATSQVRDFCIWKHHMSLDCTGHCTVQYIYIYNVYSIHVEYVTFLTECI